MKKIVVRPNALYSPAYLDYWCSNTGALRGFDGNFILIRRRRLLLVAPSTRVAPSLLLRWRPGARPGYPAKTGFDPRYRNNGGWGRCPAVNMTIMAAKSGAQGIRWGPQWRHLLTPIAWVTLFATLPCSWKDEYLVSLLFVCESWTTKEDNRSCLW